MKKNKIAGIIIMSFVLTPVFCIGQNAKKHYKAGEEFVSTKSYADAIAQYTKAIEVDPDYVKAYVSRADAYEKTGDIIQAAEDYKRAITFMPKDKNLPYQAGRLLNSAGEYEEALLMLHKATKLSKNKNLAAYREKHKAYIALENYMAAYKVADTALKLDDKSVVNYYNRALASENLNNYSSADADYTSAIQGNPGFIEAYLGRARTHILAGRTAEAMMDCSRVIARDDKNIEAYLIRSKIYVNKLEYPNAINDVSRILLLDQSNAEMYLLRGSYYQDFNQHINAITDFTKAIDLDPENPGNYYLRARSYEGMLDYAKAKKDYETIGKFSKYDGEAMRLKDEAEARLYELNRESDKPLISIAEPVVQEGNIINIALDNTEVLLKGRVEDASSISGIEINGTPVQFSEKDGFFQFLASVDISETDKLEIIAVDVYENKGTGEFGIRRTEVSGPEIQIVAPYASDNGQVFLNTDNDNIYVEGRISDKSLIKSVMIEGMLASFMPDQHNPVFSATINVMNKDRFTVVAEDVHGNQTLSTFEISREGMATRENPMGKTWVVFIQNSKYESFASLDGPGKDVSTMKAALANYQINNIILKQDMTKEELEKFFSIELRDMVRSNQVNSIMIWYAGHGKFINDVGYWIPVDAKRDDEFTYFSIANLKASLQAYSKYVTHTLVVSDACESGPTFYQAMRSVTQERSCDDYRATRFKSSQVLSSAGYELAADDSQFTRTFASALQNNPNACIPIENIVSKVTIAVARNNQQRPKFGKIAGMEDENGTFFFIAK